MEEEFTPNSLTSAEALSWLAAVRPAAALALLREPDFAQISMHAFVGFRVNSQGYANPLVRSRLAQETLKNTEFAERLQILAQELPQVPNSSEPANPVPREPAVDHQAKLRTERDAWRQEREELRRGLAQAETAFKEAERTRRQAETERDEAKSAADRQAQRFARMERQVAKLQLEQTSLLNALSQDKISPPRSHAGHSNSSPTPSQTQIVSHWEEAARHLLDKGKFDIALNLAEDVLRADAQEISALEVASQAAEAKKDTKQAAEFTRRLFSAHQARSETTQAGASLYRLLTLLPRSQDAEREAKAWLLSLRGADDAVIEAARLQLLRLRGLAPRAHGWLTSAIQANASPPLILALIPPVGGLGPDDSLPLTLQPGSLSPTARQLCSAVETGNVVLVDAARAALLRLETSHADDYKRVRAALEQAAGDEQTLLVPLLRPPRRAAVVDGSNVAWHDQEFHAAGKPRLRPLLALRRTLHQRGFFPVALYADANLPYLIDDAQRLRTMLQRGEITLVDAGVTADEVLLREAKRLGAAIVTNDYMGDWDPHGEVLKLRYTLSMTGEALLLEL